MRIWQQWGMQTSDELVSFLITRATGRTSVLGHLVSPWTTAKRKLGKGARRATCTKCGQTVFVLPYGQHGAKAKLAQTSPSIYGDALQKPCV